MNRTCLMIGCPSCVTTGSIGRRRLPRMRRSSAILGAWQCLTAPPSRRYRQTLQGALMDTVFLCYMRPGCVSLLLQSISLRRQPTIHTTAAPSPTCSSQGKVAAWLHSSGDMERCSKGELSAAPWFTVVLRLSSVWHPNVLLLIILIPVWQVCQLVVKWNHIKWWFRDSQDSLVSVFYFIFCMMKSLVIIRSCNSAVRFIWLSLSCFFSCIIFKCTDISVCEDYLLELSHLQQNMEALHRTCSAPSIQTLQVGTICDFCSSRAQSRVN